MTIRLIPRRLRGGRRMGMTEVTVRLTNPAAPGRSTEVAMIVDSGAVYSVVPIPVLQSVGIEPYASETFSLADGRSVKRKIGAAIFEIEGRRGPSPVIFGLRGDAPLLGAVTLEATGLSLDPLRRKPQPLKLMIA
jgi:clan AA aspartic protease